MTTGLTPCADWWGLELVLPPPSLVYLQVGPAPPPPYMIVDSNHTESTINLEDSHKRPHGNGDRPKRCARDPPLRPVHLPIH